MTPKEVVVFLLALALIRCGAAISRLYHCTYPRRMPDKDIGEDQAGLICQIVWVCFLMWVIAR